MIRLDETTDLRSLEVSIEEAAEMVLCTPEWLRELSRRGYFQKVTRGRVRLGDVIRAIEMSLIGIKPPGGAERY